MTFLKNIIKICFLIDIIGEKFSLFNIYKFIQLLIKRRETLIELFMLILLLKLINLNILSYIHEFL